MKLVNEKRCGFTCPICGGSLVGNSKIEFDEEYIYYIDNCINCNAEVDLVFKYDITEAFIPYNDNE